MKFRDVITSDVPAIIRLIGEVYAEYGDKLHLQGADSDLLNLTTHYEHGCFRVLLDGLTLAGTCAVRLQGRDAWLKRLYLGCHYRGKGHADAMVSWAQTWARERGARKLALWSDTRFIHAHAFYMRHNFRVGETREMDDGAMPYSEFYFSKKLCDDTNR